MNKKYIFYTTLFSTLVSHSFVQADADVAALGSGLEQVIESEKDDYTLEWFFGPEDEVGASGTSSE